MPDPTRPAAPNYKGGRGFVPVAMRRFNEEHQVKLFELPPVEFDTSTGVELPTDPLVFQAHKIKTLLDEMEQRRKSNLSNFSLKDYVLLLKEYTGCINQIRNAANANTNEPEPSDDFHTGYDTSEAGEAASASQSAPGRAGVARDVPGPRKRRQWAGSVQNVRG